MPHFLVALTVLILKKYRLLALVELRFSDDTLALLQLILHSALLVNDAAIGKEGDRFAASEVQEDVVVCDKKHLFNLVQLLEPYNANLARAGSRLKYEAEFFLLALANYNHVRGHGHALDGTDLPLILQVFVFIRGWFIARVPVTVTFIIHIDSS